MLVPLLAAGLGVLTDGWAPSWALTFWQARIAGRAERSSSAAAITTAASELVDDLHNELQRLKKRVSDLEKTAADQQGRIVRLQRELDAAGQVAAGGYHDHNVDAGATGSAGSHAHDVTGTSGTGGSHAHDVTSGSTGSHTHTVSGSAGSGGSSQENRPPYYALAFIMRIG